MCGPCEIEMSQDLRDVPTCEGLPDCPAKPVVRVGPYFVFMRSDGTIYFCHNYFRIFTEDELERLLDPQSLKSLQEIRFFSDVGRAIARKDFLIVQSLYYGIGDSPSELAKRSQVELRDALRDRVLAGQVSTN